jgi:uncharacterized protein
MFDWMNLLIVGLTFCLAGFVKGVAGMGLPTVAIGLLGLAMPPAQAAALLIIPSFITNVWQFLFGPNRWRLIRRTWAMQVAILAATAASAGMIAGGESRHAVLALGLTLIIYAVISLAKVAITVPPPTESWLSPLVGVATGVVTGATGVFVVPAVPYLQALDLKKDDLVQALGLAFTTSTIALAIGLAMHGAFQLTSSGASLLCTVPALAGMLCGQWVRAKIDPALFRRVFFIGLLVLGADLALRSLH